MTRESILVVDDTPSNLDLLSEMLRTNGYRVRPSTSGDQALHAARADPPDLVLLDIVMPQMDGFEVCRRLKAEVALKDIPVIFLSGQMETSEKVKAFSAGGVDYVTKPFHLEEILARIRTHLKMRELQRVIEGFNHMLTGLVQSQTKEILDSRMATIFAIARLAESRDDETGGHLERVQILCRTIAEALREDLQYGPLMTDLFVDNLFQASPLHDIGKLAIPDKILLKPGKLTPEEFSVVQTHTERGKKTLMEVLQFYPKNEFLKMGIEIAHSHHEKWDGSGYPQGLAGEGIPLSARIMAVVDVYDALRSRRTYKPAFSHKVALETLRDEKGSHFDPRLIQVFEAHQDKVESLYRSLGKTPAASDRGPELSPLTPPPKEG